MTNQTGKSEKRTFGQVMGNILKVALRVSMILLFGVAIGLAVYFGVPWIYRNLVEPVKRNTTALAALEQRVDREQERLQDDNFELRDRIAELETELSVLTELSALQGQDIDVSELVFSTLEARVTQSEDDLTDQEAALELLQDSTTDDFSVLDAAVLVNTEHSGILEARLVLVQAAQDLLKVELLLLEDNSRLARTTLALAVAHLTEAASLMPSAEAQLLDLQARTAALDILIEHRAYRVGAELEAIWAEVMDLITPGVTVATLTPPLSSGATLTDSLLLTPTVTLEFTPTPSPTPTPTLTPTPMPSPTPTPTLTPTRTPTLTPTLTPSPTPTSTPKP